MSMLSQSSFSGGRLTKLRQRFFYSKYASLLTLVISVVLLWALLSFFRWAVVDATWVPDPEACRQGAGACWGFVAEKWRLILFGRYPYEWQWRPALATLIVLLMLVFSAIPTFWRAPFYKYLWWGWIVSLGAFFALMLGGVFGLSRISTDMWGGLPLTVVLTLFGMGASLPIGILLALGRRSKMPIISGISTGYIELVRGIPLVTVLFVATFIFPLLLPSGFRLDAFWRVVIAIVLFQAAYIAETVRGGIQTIPRGQFLAAESLGLTKWQTYAYVILPQALVAVIPAFINSLLSCFMDTSLVTVVSMTDLTGGLKLALGDARWRSFFIEGYLLIAAIYFSFSFVVSRYSLWLERYLGGGKHH